jgi:hypothetical protein
VIDRIGARHRPDAWLAILVAACLTAACGSSITPSATPVRSSAGQSGPSLQPPASTVSSAAPSSIPSTAPSGPAAGATIPQPPAPTGVKLAPDSARVDLRVPTFSNPTNITNPLFPVSAQASVLMLGHVEGKRFRTEVTLLPYTRIIEWNGQAIETAVSQYVAYLGGEIQEVAYDHYAQADDGSVWYFGEDVSDFKGGVIITTEGTWLAGKDGPPAMIMPGHPKVGDVYRTENAPGLVFEQVTVKATDKVLDGPLGSVQGGLVARELHADGATEDKLFAPGYGEFSTAEGGDLEALALAVPTDALTGPTPAAITSIDTASEMVVRAARTGHWSQAIAAAGAIRSTWTHYRSASMPRSLRPLMDQDVAALVRATGTRDAMASQNRALDVRQSSLDLQLRYRPVREVDRARFRLWLEALRADVAARSPARIGADIFALDYIRDRIVYGPDATDATTINDQLGVLQVAVEDGDSEAIAGATRVLLRVFAGVR